MDRAPGRERSVLPGAVDCSAGILLSQTWVRASTPPGGAAAGGGCRRRENPGSRGIPLCYARDLRPLAAGSARRNCTLAKQAASWNPPHRPGSSVVGAADAGGGRSEVKRSRAGSPHGEPRTKPPSDEVPRSSGIPLRMGEDAEPKQRALTTGRTPEGAVAAGCGTRCVSRNRRKLL